MKIFFLLIFLLFFHANAFAETKRLPGRSSSEKQGRWLVLKDGYACEVVVGG